MLVIPRVPLHRLILSLSEALDHVHPEVADHQQRVAYIATRLARQMGLRDNDLLDVFYAAALHDIGLVSPQNRIAAVHLGQLEKVHWHGQMGYELLKNNPLFERAAGILRHHHVAWDHGQGAVVDGCPVPLASHILVLADSLETSINRSGPVLAQADALTQNIISLSGTQFHPDCVDAFREICRAEAFWLDVTNERIYSVLLGQIDWPVLTIDEVSLGPIAEVFARLVDAASPWTAVHSAGVTATAVALAERMDFSPRELHLMRAAGLLHDLGKLSVPVSILDKPAGLSPDEVLAVKGHTYHTFRILDTIGGIPQICEWAAFHHERLDGRGYPFRHSGSDLPLGSRIMAVADVFTAVAEDRPYRAGMSPGQTMEVLDRLVTSGGLDSEVVSLVRRHYDQIDAIRRHEQAEYEGGQERIKTVMSQTVERAA